MFSLPPKKRCAKCGYWYSPHTIRAHRGSARCRRNACIVLVRSGITRAAARITDAKTPFRVTLNHPGAQVSKTFKRWEDASHFAGKLRRAWGSSFVVCE